jgi:hypothetical protein
MGILSPKYTVMRVPVHGGGAMIMYVICKRIVIVVKFSVDFNEFYIMNLLKNTTLKHNSL